jgi:hypothetical protein
MVKESKGMAAFNNVIGFMMQISERVRREASTLATYNLELEKLLSEGAKNTAATRRQAAETAIISSQVLNSPMSVLSNTRYGQLPGWSVAFMYKGYGAKVLYLQAKALKEMKDAAKGKDKEAIIAAGNHLFTMSAMAASFAGVRGMPFMGVIAMVYDLMFADDEDEDFKTMLRKNIGTLGTDGLINTMFDANVAGRISMTDLIIPAGTTDFNQEYKGAPLALFRLLGGPGLGQVERIERGINHFNEGNLMRGFEQTLPASLANIVKAGRYATEGQRTVIGDVIVDDISPLSLLGQTLGFSSAEVTRTQEAISYRKRVERRLSEKKSRLLDQAWMSYRQRDMGKYRDVLRDIKEHNRTVRDPDARISLGKGGTLDRSFRAREADTARRVSGILFRNADLSQKEIREILGTD